MKSQIKNILFDLGGVILDIDYMKTVEAFKKLGLKNPEKAFTKEIQATLFQRFEKGEISDNDFVRALQVRMPNASDHDIISAWNALLGDFPKSRFEFLKSLKASYNLGVLSNTNSIHERAFVGIINRAVGWNHFRNLFDGICYSHVLNDRKPNISCFQKCMAELNFDPGETLFIDDTPEHVEGARNAGLLASHLKGGDVHKLVTLILNG